MARFVKGDVVVLPFPFSDLTRTKRRPALVVADMEGRDVILCQITSQTVKDSYALSLGDSGDFESGSLNRQSNIRPNQLFTADSQIILYRVAHLHSEKMQTVTESLIQLLQ